VKRRWKVAVFALITLAVLFAALLTAHNLWIESLAMQGWQTEEISDSPLYNHLGEALHNCGLQEMPRLYIAKNYPFEAWYVSTSSFPLRLRRGKIVISQEFAAFLEKSTLTMAFLHEMGHRKKDWGIFPSAIFIPGLRGPILIWHIKRSLSTEMGADAFGVKCIGRKAMADGMLAIKKLLLSNPDDEKFSEEQRKYLIKLQKSDTFFAVIEELDKRIAALPDSEN